MNVVLEMQISSGKPTYSTQVDELMAISLGGVLIEGVSGTLDTTIF
jgi:hypothetical protein